MGKARWAGVQCEVPGCEAEATSRGLCDRHYKLWKRTGSATRQGRLTHAEVATRAIAEAVLTLAGHHLLAAGVRPENICDLLRLTPDDLKAALARRAGGEPRPVAHRRGKNTDAPPGMKWCNAGQHYRRRDQFSRNRTARDGLQGWCALCIRKKHRAARLAETTHRAR